MAKKDSDNVFTAGAKATESHMKKMVQKQGKAPQRDDDEVVPFTVRIPSSLHKKARYYSIETGESMASLITRLLEEFFPND